MPLSGLRDDFDAHGARRALDALDGGFDRGGVQVGKLGLGDFADLLFGDLADFVLVRDRGALGDAGGAEQQVGGGRGLGDEGETAVGVDGNDDRNRQVRALNCLQNSMMLTCA